MFLVDDVIFSPVRSLVWIFREIHHAAEKDMAGEPAAITAKLGELYMMLETGQMTAADFDVAEKALLDRLDVLKEETASGEEEGGGDDEEEGDDQDEQEEEEEGEGEEEDETARENGDPKDRRSHERHPEIAGFSRR
jgi:hypothetical protein